MVLLIVLSSRLWLSTAMRLWEAVGICLPNEFVLKRLFLCMSEVTK